MTRANTDKHYFFSWGHLLPSGQTMAVAPGRPGVGSVRTPVKFGGPPLGGTEKSTVILFASTCAQSTSDSVARAREI